MLGGSIDQARVHPRAEFVAQGCVQRQLHGIAEIAFETSYTHIVLSNSTSVNVIEGKDEIEKMFYHLESVIINKDIASYTHDDDFWDVTPYDDDLPF